MVPLTIAASTMDVCPYSCELYVKYEVLVMSLIC